VNIGTVAILIGGAVLAIFILNQTQQAASAVTGAVNSITGIPGEVESAAGTVAGNLANYASFVMAGYGSVPTP
jgi:hypothetical protein